MSPVHARTLAGVAGVVGFTILGHEVDAAFWTQWWYWVGAGTAVGAVFLEPHFTKPQDAIYNSLGGVVVWLTAPRHELGALWAAFGIVWVLSLVAGLLAAVMVGDGRFKRLLFRSSSAVGRTKTVGFASLVLAAASLATVDSQAAGWLMAASLLLLAGLSDPVVETLSSSLPTSRSATLIDAFGPGLVLVGGLPRGAEPGARLSLSLGGKAYELDLVQTLPGADGARGVALVAEDWEDLARAFPRQGRLTQIEGESHATVGIVSAGSTPETLHLTHGEALEVGQPLVVPEAGQGDEALFQVFGVRLAEQVWAGSRALGPVAQLRQLGRNSNGYLRPVPNLPLPHAAVRRPTGPIDAVLPAGYLRLGVVKGTAFPIGISTDQFARGHVAVLGMSGMGKTTSSHRLLTGLAGQGLALALDATGEYRKTLGLVAWGGDATVEGMFVREIVGDLPVTTQSSRHSVDDRWERRVWSGSANASSRAPGRSAQSDPGMELRHSSPTGCVRCHLPRDHASEKVRPVVRDRFATHGGRSEERSGPMRDLHRLSRCRRHLSFVLREHRWRSSERGHSKPRAL